jgi:NAD+ diphosphatase
MIGFQAEYVSGEPAADDLELEDARWFTRDEMRSAASADAEEWLLLPPRIAIARRLVDAWLTGG